MGIHSPFGYVGYITPMGKSIVDMLERFCGHCHTDDDYDKGCRGCPVGNFIYEARDYILTASEEDKHYALYASDEWQERRKANGRPEETVEQREKWAKLAKKCKPESIALRGMKKELKHIGPYPFFYGQWRWDSIRNKDPLAKFREYLKDYEFHEERQWDNWKVAALIDKRVKARLRKELLPIVQKADEELEAEIEKERTQN